MTIEKLPDAQAWQELQDDFRRTDRIFARLRDESFPDDVRLIGAYVNWFIDVGSLLSGASVRLEDKCQFNETGKLLSAAKESIYERAMNSAGIAVDDRLGCSAWFAALKDASDVRGSAQRQAMVAWLAVRDESDIPGPNWNSFQATKEQAHAVYADTVTALGASWLAQIAVPVKS